MSSPRELFLGGDFPPIPLLLHTATPTWESSSLRRNGDRIISIHATAIQARLVYKLICAECSLGVKPMTFTKLVDDFISVGNTDTASGAGA